MTDEEVAGLSAHCAPRYQVITSRFKNLTTFSYQRTDNKYHVQTPKLGVSTEKRDDSFHTSCFSLFAPRPLLHAPSATSFLLINLKNLHAKWF
jgi:hypothetical protein